MLYSATAFLALIASPSVQAWTAGSMPTGRAVRSSEPVTMRDVLIGTRHTIESPHTTS